MAFELRTSETRYKFIQERVKCVETSFNDFCQSFGGLVRTNAKLRNKGDELTKHLLGYSDKMNYNSSSKAALQSVAQELAFVHDYQDIKVKRLEALVVQPLMLYSTIIKQSKADIKAAHDAATREQKSMQEVEQVRQKAPSDARQISKVETKLQKAHVDASRMGRALEEAIETFEQKKLHDLKAVLSSYVATEMAFHAKSLETLTKCYEQLQVLDEEEDLKEFGSVLHPSSATERLAMMKGQPLSGSRTSIASLSPSAVAREHSMMGGDGSGAVTAAVSGSPSRRSGTLPAAAVTAGVGGSSSSSSTLPPRLSVDAPGAGMRASSTPVKVTAPPRQSMLGGDDNDDDDDDDDETGDSDDDSENDEDDDDDGSDDDAHTHGGVPPPHQRRPN